MISIASISASTEVVRIKKVSRATACGVELGNEPNTRCTGRVGRFEAAHDHRFGWERKIHRRRGRSRNISVALGVCANSKTRVPSRSSKKGRVLQRRNRGQRGI